MNRSRIALLLGLTALGLAQPAFAQTAQTSTVPSCTVFCRIWQSVSAGPTVKGPAVAVPASPPQPYVMDLSPDEVEPPVPSKIVAERGVVMAETPAERTKRKRDYAAMVKSIVPAEAKPQGSPPATH